MTGNDKLSDMMAVMEQMQYDTFYPIKIWPNKLDFMHLIEANVLKFNNPQTIYLMEADFNKNNKCIG